MKENNKEKFNAFLSKAQVVSKRTFENVHSVAKNFSEKVKSDSQERKLKKLNPLFWEEYRSEMFHLPNIIKIVDDAERRDIELCEGAIGWRNKEANTEVLFLYDEVEKECGLEFVPNFSCNSIYCVDPYDRKRYIRTDCIFVKAEEEKLAELENIAFCLGAKRCSIEMSSSESTTNIKTRSYSASVEDGVASSSSTQSSTDLSTSRNSGKNVIEFKGHDHPTEPELKWFSCDETIKNLIKMRCQDPESIKSRSLELSGASSATMSVQTAMAVDAVAKGVKTSASSSMEMQSTKEMNRKLIYIVEF